jgi:anti-anti-sigma factor
MTAVEAVTNMVPGHHACLFYASEAERQAALLCFLRAGLEAGERVVYLAGDGRADSFASEDHELSADLSSGQLQVHDAEAMYLADGPFDPDRMIERLATDIAAARDEGFAGYRVAGDMEWSLSSAASAQALLDYEDGVDALLHRSGATALCQYDRRRFDLSALGEAACVHPLILSDCSAGAASPHELLVEPGPRQELVLRGEVDCSNSSSLTHSLEAAIARKSELRLDLRELSFIDVAGLRALGRAGERLEAAGGRLTLISPRLLMTRLLAMLEIDGPLTIEEAA